MKVRVRVEEGLCCGFGHCVHLCPRMFDLDPQTNRATTLHATAAADLIEQVRLAASECPTQAIEITPAEEL